MEEQCTKLVTVAARNRTNETRRQPRRRNCSPIQSVFSHLTQRSSRKLLPCRVSRIDCGAATPPQCLQLYQRPRRCCRWLSGLLLMRLLVVPGRDRKRGKLQGEDGSAGRVGFIRHPEAGGLAGPERSPPPRTSARG